MILALDPSMRCFGALFVSEGMTPVDGMTCRTVPKDSDATKPLGSVRRVGEVADFCRKLARMVEGYSARVVIELPSGSKGAGGHLCSCGKGQHVPGLYLSAKAEGMVLAICATVFGPENPIWVTPQEVKAALLGKRSGSKDEMMAAAGPKLEVIGWSKKSEPVRETLADCYAIALAGLKK